MNRIILLLIVLLSHVNSFSQDCDGITCISNPNIIQEDIIVCYQDGVDTSSWWQQYNECSQPCFEVCENSYNTYSTTYHVGSFYNWSITGGQIIASNNTGNIINVLWGSSGPGNISVEEYDSTGCSKIANQCVEIITTPIASITTVPTSNIVCQNTNIQFYGNNLNPVVLSSQSCLDSNTQNWIDTSGTYVYELEYFWDFGDGTTSIDQNPQHTYSNVGNYTVTLVIVNSCQCSDTITTSIDVVNTLGPEITSSCFGTVCEGDTIEYCTNASMPNWTIEGGVFYNSVNTDNCILIIWDNHDNELNDGLGSIFIADLSSSCGSSSTIMNVPAVPNNAVITGKTNVCDGSQHKYSFACIPGVDYDWQLIGNPWNVNIIDGFGSSEIIIENGLWSSGASYQLQLNMTSSSLDCSFNPIILDIDILPKLYINGISSVCQDDLSTYSVWSSSSVQWEVINGTIQTPCGSPCIASQIDVVWDQGFGKGSVKAIITTPGIYCNDQESILVDIKETPPSAIDIINDVLGDTLVCPGEEYLYTVNPTSQNSNVNSKYSWTIQGGVPTSHSGDNCIITWDPTGPYEIDIINTSSGLPSCQSNVFTKTINQLSTSTPNIAGNSIVCINDRSNFEITNLYPNDVNITWSILDPNLGSIVDGQGTNNIIVEWGNQLGTTVITASVEVCGVIVTNSYSVNLIGASISFTTPSSIICPLSNISFVASSSVGNFIWDFGDGNTTTIVNNSSVTHSYQKPGRFKVTLALIDLNNCTSLYSSYVEVLGPVGHINPQTALNYCSGSSYAESLSVTTASNSNPVSWEWYHNGNFVQSGGSTYQFSLIPPNYLEAGTYYVEMTDSNGCSNTTDDINVNIVTCTPGGGGGGNPPISGSSVPIPYSMLCNNTFGSLTISLTSPNGSSANFYILGLGSELNTTSANFTISEAGNYRAFCFDLNGNQIGYTTIDVPFVTNFISFPSCDPTNNNQITMEFRDSSSYLLGLSGLLYSWDFGDGNSSSLQNPIHTYTIPGVYSVDFSVSYGNLTCNLTKQIEAEFNASFTYSGPLCEETPTISFLSSNIQIDSWLWDFDDGATSAREIPDRTYLQPGLYNPSLIATSSDGCTASYSVPLQIYAKPVINSISSINQLCSNDPQVNLNNIVSYSLSNGETSVWSGPGIVLNLGNYYFDPLLAGGGTHEVCVTVTNNDGCVESQCINIIVVCPEKPRIFGESDYCFDPNSWNGQNLQTQNGYSDYIWYKNSILHSGPSNWGYYLNLNESVGNYDISVSFVDDNGCTGMSDIFVLNINSTPTPVSISSNGTCPGSQITLTHNGNQNNVDYYWNTIPRLYGNTVDVIAEENFHYQVIAINEFGCESTSYNYIDIPNKVDLCNILSGCFCDSTLFNSNNLIEVQGLDNYWMYYNYEWLINGNSFTPPQTSGTLIIDPLDPNYTNIAQQNISLSVTDNYGCIYESENLIIEPNCISCFNAITEFYIDTTICEGTDISVGSNIYNTSGNYTEYLVAQNGCDSTVNISLTVNINTVDTQNIIICDGDSVIVGSNIYNSEGFFTDIFIDNYGCDSIINTSLTVLNNSYNSLNPYLCYGDTLFTINNFYASSGLYSETLISANGCDSILDINLVVYPNSNNSISPILCAGNDFVIGNSSYSSTGIYNDTLVNIYGCDSIVTTNLTINPTYNNVQLLQTCYGDSVSVGNNFYDSSGIYTDSLMTINGCDSVLISEVIIDSVTAVFSANPPYLNLNILSSTPPLSFVLGNQFGTILTSSNNFGNIFTFNPIVNGTYYAVISDSLDCISDSIFFNVDFITSSVDDNDVRSLIIYPNPSKDKFNISFVSDRHQDIRIKIYSSIGKTVYNEKLQKYVGDYSRLIDLGKNEKGIYFLEILTENSIINKKIILQ